MNSKATGTGWAPVTGKFECVANRRTECECTVKECLEWCLLSHQTGSRSGKQVRQHWSFLSRHSKSQREGESWHLCEVGIGLVLTYTRTKLRDRSCWKTDNDHYFYRFSWQNGDSRDKKDLQETRHISFLPSEIGLNYSAAFEFFQHTCTGARAKREGTSRRHDQPNSTDHAVLVPNWKTQQKHFSRTSEPTLARATPEG